MQSDVGKARRGSASIAVSLTLHGAVFAFVLYLGARIKDQRVPDHLENTMALLEVAGGPRAPKVPLPRMSDVGVVPKIAPEQTRPKVEPPRPQEQRAKKPDGGAPMNPRSGDGTGRAETGSGADAENVTPSFPTFSPRPPVSDRALLPAKEQKIVVDVDVDALGGVVREILVKGLGNKLDQVVLDTVKTWHFQPATKDGKPVPTEAELIFPFGPDTPITMS
jgi:outer membrane biosynthesis protein TonB